MTLNDQEMTVMVLREAQLILANYIQPGPRDREKTIQEQLEVLDRRRC
jgi:hypothetical protein